MSVLEYLFLVWIIVVTIEGRTNGLSTGRADYEIFYKDALPPNIADNWYEIVFPVQLRNGEILPNLETWDHKPTKQKRSHFHGASFEMNLLGRKYRIRLDLSRELFANGLKLKYNQNSKVQYVEEISVENCYYQGQVRRATDSLVVLSTCSGLKGVIVLNHQIYIIQPVALPSQNSTEGAARFPHVVYRSVTDTNASCANNRGMWMPYKDLHSADFLRNLKYMKLNEDSILSETKYIRTAFVVDNVLFSKLNMSFGDMLHHVGLIANIADALLDDVDVKMKLRLVLVELWNQNDLFEVAGNARETLTSFLRYRQDAFTNVHVNYAHFLSGKHFDDNELGMAVADSVCTHRAVAISKSESGQDLWQSSFGVVHMLAHVLGVDHDALENCLCTDMTGCIMSQSSMNTHARSWSTCSINGIHTAIRSRLTGCLLSANGTSGTGLRQQDGMFSQTCGNGKTERGEECDCRSTEECELIDPCCDAKTCLLKPWATCRYGSCCQNCTIRPSNQMCRSAAGECDVPEFCDGQTGYCPDNVLTLDGEECGTKQGYCYQGLCKTYSSQCQSIWGSNAVAGDEKCYDTFNTAGRFNGHCGHNVTTSDYLKCTTKNTKCGLLHCSGGSEKPLTGENQTFSKTVVYFDGKEYECKIVNGPVHGSQRSMTKSVGMVQDGSRCGPGNVCIGSECVALSKVMPATCVVGSNGAVCSGHGVCTAKLKCSCYEDFAGFDCGERSNVTIIPLPTSTPDFPPTTTRTPSALEVESQNVTYNMTTAFSHSTPQSDYNRSGGRNDQTSTVWLLIVLVVVIGMAMILLVFCLLCYRRRSPVSQNKQRQMKNMTHGTFSSLSPFGTSSYNKQQEVLRASSPVSSVVKFGKTPSWKAEKMKRAMKQQRESGASETGSADRDSSEFKQVPSLPPADPPERGILKKCSRSLVEGTRQTHGASQSSLASHSTPTKISAVDNVLSAPCEGVDERILENQLEFIDAEDDDRCSYCNCSVDEDIEAVKAGGGDGTAVAVKSGCTQETQTDLDSPMSSLSRTSIYSESSGKLARLCNINELLRQIDEQFNSVLLATSAATASADLSPSNSDEFRGSETEADRACLGFFRQSDAEAACPSISAKLSQPASQKLDGFCGSGSPKSSFKVISGAATPPCVPLTTLDTDTPTRLSFKPLALPVIPKLSELDSSPENENDVRWRPQTSFVPYRGLLMKSDVATDSLKWNPHGPSGMLPQCTAMSSSPATVPSEGYHSDRGGAPSEHDVPVIVREIPRNALRLAPITTSGDAVRHSGALLHSPEDVNV